MFFNKKKKLENNSDFVKIGALFIHAAKIDENFSEKEEEIIKKALIQIGAKETVIEKIIIDAKEIEANSNQILEFTKEVKTMKENEKIAIIETLWRIIFSNNKADIYETNLMRRLEGLLYIDSNIMGTIKDKIKKEKN